MESKNKVVYLTDYIHKNKNIKTLGPENIPVNLAKPHSNLIKRTWALGIDLLSISLINTGIHTSYALFIQEFLGPVHQIQKMDLVNGNMALHSMVFVSIYWVYFLYCTYVLNGKTLGKMSMGLRVVNESFFTSAIEMNYTLDFRNSFRRALGYLVCYLSFGTFFIFNFSSEDKRGLPDYLSKSRTVSDTWLAQMLAHKGSPQEVVLINIHALEKAA